MRIYAFLATILLLIASPAPATGQDSGIPPGSPMPGTAVALTGPGGATTLGAQKGSAATLVVFWSNRCPWGTKLEGRLANYVRQYRDRGVKVVLVNSNDAGAFAQEGPTNNAATSTAIGATVFGDTTSELGRAFGATRNPAFYLFDDDDTLIYSGSFDDSPADEAAVETPHLDLATQAMLSGSPPATQSTKAFGCMINPVRG